MQKSDRIPFKVCDVVDVTTLLQVEFLKAFRPIAGDRADLF